MQVVIKVNTELKRVAVEHNRCKGCFFWEKLRVSDNEHLKCPTEDVDGNRVACIGVTTEEINAGQNFIFVRQD